MQRRACVGGGGGGGGGSGGAVVAAPTAVWEEVATVVSEGRHEVRLACHPSRVSLRACAR